MCRAFCSSNGSVFMERLRTIHRARWVLEVCEHIPVRRLPARTDGADCYRAAVWEVVFLRLYFSEPWALPRGTGTFKNISMSKLRPTGSGGAVNKKRVCVKTKDELNGSKEECENEKCECERQKLNPHRLARRRLLKLPLRPLAADYLLTHNLHRHLLSSSESEFLTPA